MKAVEPAPPPPPPPPPPAVKCPNVPAGVTVGPDGKNAKKEVFASGFLEGDQGYLGRPADIILAKDGSILVADDWAGAIYRISYSKK